ncbi:MAG: hypothetical protein IJX89_01225 [Alphaproteobacteria bacterium]|nr:hypothetical protein [Alphaproteobacteria bacterium]
MKKVLVSMISLIALAGCSSYYDYYKGGIRYTQDGDDCIFYSAERGRHYSEDIRSLDLDKKIVYRNTMCRDLYTRDNFAQPSRTERQIVTSIAPSTPKSNCGCNKCGKTKKYVFVK